MHQLKYGRTTILNGLQQQNITLKYGKIMASNGEVHCLKLVYPANILNQILKEKKTYLRYNQQIITLMKMTKK